eukprot:CAMPEP_0172484404 /NCGR_PEP_ID=MMETSP1066-20121228/11874_1 /TAXON_ID=671091 /ORGANISM="Coscinodiscus wailesii, Strain CCMP2513" /LENGTH=1021 /DNA_ID=CAMNT_0013248915 /DNA_START=151 /DNA_END=3212 /DNA_ORIENTATION=-
MKMTNSQEKTSPANISPSNEEAETKQTLPFVKLVVRYPCGVFTATILFCFLLCFLLGRFTFGAGSPFTDENSSFDIYDVRSVAYDSFRLAREQVAFERDIFEEQQQQAGGGGGGGGDPAAPPTFRIQEKTGDLTYWIFESETPEGLFHSADSIGVMREAETLFSQKSSYRQYCQLRYSGDDDDNTTTSSCVKPLSALNMYYASEWNTTVSERVVEELSREGNKDRYNAVALCVEYYMDCDSLSPELTASLGWARRLNADINSIVFKWDGEGDLNDDIASVTIFAAHLNEIVTKKRYVDFFFDANFTVDNPVSLYSRSIVFWGAPLAGFEGNETVQREGSRRKSSEAQDEKRKRYIIDNFLSDLKKVSSPDHSSLLNSYYFMGALFFDVILDILTQDCMKAIMSFVLIFTYLRITVGSWFLALVGLLEIFLSVPTAWFLSSVVLRIKYFPFLNSLSLFIVAAIGADDIFVFMDAYKQSAHRGDQVNSSFESRMDWVYRRSGKAMLITSCTTCTAFLCTCFSPIAGTRAFGIFAALVILMDYVLVMTLFCTATVIYHNYFESRGFCGCFLKKQEKVTPTKSDIPTAILVAENSDNSTATPNANKQETEGDKVSTFFRTTFASTIMRPRIRYLICLLSTTWVIIASYYASQLRATQSTEQFLDENHPLQKAATILSSQFPVANQDAGAKIYFIWGLGDVDRRGVSQLYDPEKTGVPTFNEFQFNEKCQRLVLDACHTLKRDEAYEANIKRRASGLRSVDCFIEEFAAYNALGGNLVDKCDAVKAGTWKNDGSNWQVPSEEVNNVMSQFVKETSCLAGDGEDIISSYDGGVGWNGTSLLYAAISFESSVIDPWSTLAEDVVRKEYDTFVALARNFSDQLSQVCNEPEECGGDVIMTDTSQKFIFMNNQKIYRTSAVSGSMIGVAIAFVVLVASTGKVHIAFFATLSILFVLVSVIGSVTIGGWTLGTNEAILISILAGFSVDYIVHLAHAYVEAEGSGTTEERVRSAFGDMGVSVFSGMFTSVVA